MALLVLEFHVLITVELLHNGHLGDRRKWPLLGGTGEIRNMYGGGHKLGPHHTNVCKFSQICRAISSSLLTAWDVSLSNLAMLLILRHSLQWCQRIFLNWFISKVDKPFQGLLHRPIRTAVTNTSKDLKLNTACVFVSALFIVKY